MKLLNYVICLIYILQTMYDYIYIVLIISFIIFFIFLCTRKRKKINDGETKVVKLLSKICKKCGGYLINNIIITDSYGNSSEIDHILFLRCGIYVIETKNHSGKIMGDQFDDQWKQMLKNNSIVNDLYNPIKQNQSHVKKICYFLKHYENIHSCIIFVKADISNVQYENIFNMENFRNYILSNHNKHIFSKSQLYEYYSVILKQKNNPITSRKQHLKNIKKNSFCPKCSGKLILKISNENPYLVCEHYPKCKYFKKIN